MSLPWVAGRVLSPNEFKSYYRQVMWNCRHCTIRPKEYLPLLDFPLLMKPGEWPRLAALTEKLSCEITAAEQELLGRPDLFESLGLQSRIANVLRNCTQECRPKGFAPVMRFDFYFTSEGWKFSEANPDGPSGYVEAEGLTRAMAAFYPGFSAPLNPAAVYSEAIRRFGGKSASVAFFHRARRVAKWCPQFILKEVEKRGMRGVLANPRHLVWKSNRAEVLTPSGTVRPDLLVRILISDWLPNLRRRDLWAPWFCGGKTPMSNPGSAIVVESKRLPLVYKELDTPASKCRAFSPESRSPEEVPRASQNQWVFKPAFGFGGFGIALAGVTKKEAFKRIAEEARRHATKWVAQRRFESVPVLTERGPGHVCLGVYTVDGIAAGMHCRIRGKPLIDRHAMVIPILVPEADSQGGTAGIEKFSPD